MDSLIQPHDGSEVTYAINWSGLVKKLLYLHQFSPMTPRSLPPPPDIHSIVSPSWILSFNHMMDLK
jgi:hypothetical protein